MAKALSPAGQAQLSQIHCLKEQMCADCSVPGPVLVVEPTKVTPVLASVFSSIQMEDRD